MRCCHPATPRSNFDSCNNGFATRNRHVSLGYDCAFECGVLRDENTSEYDERHTGGDGDDPRTISQDSSWGLTACNASLQLYAQFLLPQEELRFRTRHAVRSLRATFREISASLLVQGPLRSIWYCVRSTASPLVNTYCSVLEPEQAMRPAWESPFRGRGIRQVACR